MNDTARTLKNCPVTEAFHLECYRHAGVRQVLQTFSPTRVRTFERNYYATEGGNWSEWYQIINQSSVDSSLSASSTNPVQNKVVNAQLTSLNNNKANTNHTHNNYTATTTVTCNYGTVKKFKKNGWAFVVYENINISPLSLEVWTEIADIGWSNQAGNEYTANFQTSVPEDRFRITEDGKLSAMKYGDSNHRGHYGYIVYPTAD